MIGSWEDGEVILHMSVSEAKCLVEELFYTIDYRPEEYPDYDALQRALHQGLRRREGA